LSEQNFCKHSVNPVIGPSIFLFSYRSRGRNRDRKAKHYGLLYVVVAWHGIRRGKNRSRFRYRRRRRIKKGQLRGIVLLKQT